MSFANFTSFLKNGIFLPHAIKFSDKWEGLLPLSIIKSERHGNYKEMYDLISPWLYISCWHRSLHESYAMWKIYGQENEAVAIHYRWAN